MLRNTIGVFLLIFIVGWILNETLLFVKIDANNVKKQAETRLWNETKRLKDISIDAFQPNKSCGALNEYDTLYKTQFSNVCLNQSLTFNETPELSLTKNKVLQEEFRPDISNRIEDKNEELETEKARSFWSYIPPRQIIIIGFLATILTKLINNTIDELWGGLKKKLMKNGRIRGVR